MPYPTLERQKERTGRVTILYRLSLSEDMVIFNGRRFHVTRCFNDVKDKEQKHLLVITPLGVRLYKRK